MRCLDLREPTEWKCIWTCHQSHFVCKFTGKMPHSGQRFVRFCAVEMHMDIAQQPFCVEIYRKLAGHG